RSQAGCLLMAHSGLIQPFRNMSAFRGKADSLSCSPTRPLMTQSGHPVLLEAINESGRPLGRPLKRTRISLAQRSRRLFWGAYKQGAGQFAICTDERCVVALVVFTKNGNWAGVGVFFGQRFVGRAITVKFCIYGGLSIVHQSCFGSDKILTV